MVSLSFTLHPSACNVIHGALVCFAKISETVSFEATKEHLTISTLNLSKTVHAAISFEPAFFDSYSCTTNDKFSFSILNKALQPIFKLKPSNEQQQKDKISLEKCEIAVEDESPHKECRLTARNYCHAGVTKVYKLTYEATDVMHAIFERPPSMNSWSIKSSFLRENLEFFSTKVQQLDISHHDDDMSFVSFTNKIVTDKKEVLRQPLKTTVNVNKADFSNFDVEQDLHIVINVKDFKTIVLHADSLEADLRALYSTSGRPLQFSYEKPGFICKFTVMTAGPTGNMSHPSTASKKSNSSFTVRAVTNNSNTPQTSMSMPPPSRVEGRRNTQTLGRRRPEQETQTLNPPVMSQSLFVPLDDEDNDNAWDPSNYDDGEEVLAWDSRDPDEPLFQPQFRTENQSHNPTSQQKAEGLPPTQRISQIPRLF